MKTASHFAKERQPDDVTEHEMGHVPSLVRLLRARCSGIAKLCSWHFLVRTSREAAAATLSGGSRKGRTM